MSKEPEKGLTQADKVKLGVAAGIFVIALLFIAHTAGLITLWGGEAVVKAPPETPQQVQEKQQAVQQAKKFREEQANNPRAVKAGE